MHQLLPSPVIVNRHSAASKECRCFGHNAVFVLRLQAEQRLAVLVAAQCENRGDETCAVLRSEQPLPFCCMQADTLHEAFSPIGADDRAVRIAL